MPSWIKLFGGWALAALIAIAFSWGAVAQVRNRVIRPSIEIPTTVAAPSASTTADPTTATSSPPVVRLEPETGEEATTTVDPTDLGSTTTTTPPPPPTGQHTEATTTTTSAPQTTSPAAPPPTTTQPPPTSTTTTRAPPQTETSSYQLTGGVVTIGHSPGVVTFISAVPQSGFSTDPREIGPDRVRVRFESETHTSDFRAEWEGGELTVTKNETGGD